MQQGKERRYPYNGNDYRSGQKARKVLAFWRMGECKTEDLGKEEGGTGAFWELLLGLKAKFVPGCKGQGALG